MTFDTLIALLHDRAVMLPLVCSVIAGALIGGEREFQRKPAGLRTHTLVCFASAMMTVLGLRIAEWTAVLPEDVQMVTDFARMPHAILTGIGFLCAGVIFREGASVQGLTTAASLWLTAALGIVFGAGLLELGVIGTAIALVVLVLLRLLQVVTPAKPTVKLSVTVAADSLLDRAALVGSLAAQGLKAGPVSMTLDQGADLRCYQLLASTQAGEIDCERLARSLQDCGPLRLLSIQPLEAEMS
jgi:putative Mg2+ transporter-C (MgtC) family protein